MADTEEKREQIIRRLREQGIELNDEGKLVNPQDRDDQPAAPLSSAPSDKEANDNVEDDSEDDEDDIAAPLPSFWRVLHDSFFSLLGDIWPGLHFAYFGTTLFLLATIVLPAVNNDCPCNLLIVLCLARLAYLCLYHLYKVRSVSPRSGHHERLLFDSKCDACRSRWPARSIHCDSCSCCVVGWIKHSAVLNRCIGVHNYGHILLYTWHLLCYSSAFFVVFTSISVGTWINPEGMNLCATSLMAPFIDCAESIWPQLFVAVLFGTTLTSLLLCMFASVTIPTLIVDFITQGPQKTYIDSSNLEQFDFFGSLRCVLWQNIMQQTKPGVSFTKLFEFFFLARPQLPCTNIFIPENEKEDLFNQLLSGMKTDDAPVTGSKTEQEKKND